MGENKKAVIPSGGMKDPTQKSNMDVNDKKKHLTRDVFGIDVFLNMLALHSSVSARVKK
ncbi:MAG: hypothetical protein LBP21_08650 [Synergistaceae bacterium]|nr:hypothetical protein [Synergistaceae bacterium]